MSQATSSRKDECNIQTMKTETNLLSSYQIDYQTNLASIICSTKQFKKISLNMGRDKCADMLKPLYFSLNESLKNCTLSDESEKEQKCLVN